MGRAEVSSTGAPYLVGSALTLTLAVSTRKISAAQRCMVVREVQGRGTKTIQELYVEVSDQRLCQRN